MRVFWWRLAMPLFLICRAAAWGQAQAVAIRDAAVVTVSGPTIAKGTVFLRGGLIEAVGTSVSIPPDAWVVEGEGLTVYPRRLDAASNWGMPPNLSPGSAA